MAHQHSDVVLREFSHSSGYSLDVSAGRKIDSVVCVGTGVVVRVAEGRGVLVIETDVLVAVICGVLVLVGVDKAFVAVATMIDVGVIRPFADRISFGQLGS